MKKTALFILFIAYNLQLTANLYADTTHTKDGQEIKGIVVEDYKDRVTFSTADGEISVMKSDIHDLYYDSEEDNLIKLAQQAQERGDYQKSYAYYGMARRINPLSKIARDGIVFLQGYLYRKEEVRKEEVVKRQQELELYGPMIPTEKSEEGAFKENAVKLKESIGIILDMKDSLPEVATVLRNSPAFEAGIIKGDLLAAIWGRLTGYMPLREVVKMLLDKPVLEIKCTIERTVDVAAGGGDIGASFSMEFDGLTVSAVKEGSTAFESGLMKDDLIVAINGRSTRYMPLKKALELIKKSKNSAVRFTFRRELTIWRRQKV